MTEELADALVRLVQLRAELDAALGLSPAPAPRTRPGARPALVPGDVVFDPETGEEGIVEHVTTVTAIGAAPGGE